MSSPGYTDAEIKAIGGWLKEGLSAGKIVGAFYAEFQRPVSRNAVIGIVSRNAGLKAIGFAREGKVFSGGRKPGPSSPRLAKAKADRGVVPARAMPVRFAPIPSLRSVNEMIDGREAPKPANAPDPRPLAELSNRQCHFPVSGAGAATLFCAADVAPLDWMPGASGGCYCRLHRALAIRREAA